MLASWSPIISTPPRSREEIRAWRSLLGIILVGHELREVGVRSQHEVPEVRHHHKDGGELVLGIRLCLIF